MVWVVLKKVEKQLFSYDILEQYGLVVELCVVVEVVDKVLVDVEVSLLCDLFSVLFVVFDDEVELKKVKVQVVMVCVQFKCLEKVFGEVFGVEQWVIFDELCVEVECCEVILVCFECYVLKFVVFGDDGQVVLKWVKIVLVGKCVVLKKVEQVGVMDSELECLCGEL